jgi:hypothetical protein
MKKTLLGLSMLAIAAVSFAQPTIQANQYDYASVQEFTFKYSSGQTAISPGASGANVTWNFSSLTGSSTYNYTTAACPGETDCGTFPGANQVLILASLNSKTYWKKTTNTLEQTGEKGNSTSSDFVYTDPIKFMQFPMTFGQTYSDTYTGAAPIGTKTGMLNSTIDAYGTLTTPAGTFANVLRQKIVETATVTVSGQPSTIQFTHYYWFAPNVHHYLMAIIVAEPIGLPVPVPATYVATYSTGSGGTGINNEVLNNEIAVYPNPINDRFTIQTGTLNVESVEVYNILGQKVLNKSFAGKNTSATTIDNLQLRSGYYFLKINTDKGLATKQITIQ